MKIVIFFVLLAVAATFGEEDCEGDHGVCTLEYAPICANNGEEDRQFSGSCQLDYVNCENRNANKPEYKRVGRQYCDESKRPKSWSRIRGRN